MALLQPGQYFAYGTWKSGRQTPVETNIPGFSLPEPRLSTPPETPPVAPMEPSPNPYDEEYESSQRRSPIKVDAAGTIRENRLFQTLRSIGHTPEEQAEMLRLNPLWKTLSTLEIMRRRAAVNQPYTMSPTTRGKILADIGGEAATARAAQQKAQAKAEVEQETKLRAERAGLEAGAREKAERTEAEPFEQRAAADAHKRALELEEKRQAGRLTLQEERAKAAMDRMNAIQDRIEVRAKTMAGITFEQKRQLADKEFDREIEVLKANRDFEGAMALYEEKNRRERAIDAAFAADQKAWAEREATRKANEARGMKVAPAAPAPVRGTPSPVTEPPQLKPPTVAGPRVLPPGEAAVARAEQGGIEGKISSMDLDMSGLVDQDEAEYDEIQFVLKKHAATLTPTEERRLKERSNFLWQQISKRRSENAGAR